MFHFSVDVQAALDDAYLAAAAEAEASATVANAAGASGLGAGVSDKLHLGANSSSTAATGSSSAEGSTAGVGPGDHRNSLLLLGDAFTPMGGLTVSSTASSLSQSRGVSTGLPFFGLAQLN